MTAEDVQMDGTERSGSFTNAYVPEFEGKQELHKLDEVHYLCIAGLSMCSRAQDQPQQSQRAQRRLVMQSGRNEVEAC